MENKLTVLLPATLLALLTVTACTRNMAVHSASKADSTNVAQINGGIGGRVNVNTKVLRSFFKTYGEMPGTKWFKSANGFGVMFKDNGMNKTIYYKLDGLVDTEILYYSEDRLPAQVRHFVKSRFYDYAITYVTEVHKNGATAFYVKVEDASTIKTLKIVEGEWEEVESLVKRVVPDKKDK
jgi:hypothetical protein